MNSKLNFQNLVKKTVLWQAAFAIIGLATCLYLFIHHTRLESGIQESASFCSFGRFVDCDSVNISRFSEIFGVPIAALGALYFFTLLSLSFLVTSQDKFFINLQRFMAWITGLATIYNLVLLFIVQIVILKSFCLMCFLTYVCTGGHLFFNIKLAGVDEKTIKNKLLNAFKRPEFSSFKTMSHMRWIFGAISLITFISLLSVLPYFIRSSSSANTFVENSIQQFFVTWKDLPQRKLPVSLNDGTWGDPNSPVQIVEFSDFECPFCRKAAFTIHTTLKLFENRVFFVFKNFPLDSSCNPNLPYQLHAHACKLARLAACAQTRGKFWAFHDLAFLKMSDEDIKEGFDHISEILRPVFTVEEIAACLSDSKTLKKVTEDIQTGTSLKIKSTPSIFINGKLVTIPLTVEVLKKLLTLELMGDGGR